MASDISSSSPAVPNDTRITKDGNVTDGIADDNDDNNTSDVPSRAADIIIHHDDIDNDNDNDAPNNEADDIEDHEDDEGDTNDSNTDDEALPSSVAELVARAQALEKAGSTKSAAQHYLFCVQRFHSSNARFGNVDQISICLQRLAVICAQNNKFKEALQFRQAEKLIWEARILSAMPGKVKPGATPSVDPFVTKPGVDIPRAMLADERKALEYEHLGKMFFEQKNTEMAKNYAQKAIDLRAAIKAKWGDPRSGLSGSGIGGIDALSSSHATNRSDSNGNDNGNNGIADRDVLMRRLAELGRDRYNETLRHYQKDLTPSERRSAAVPSAVSSHHSLTDVKRSSSVDDAIPSSHDMSLGEQRREQSSTTSSSISTSSTSSSSSSSRSVNDSKNAIIDHQQNDKDDDNDNDNEWNAAMQVLKDHDNARARKASSSRTSSSGSKGSGGTSLSRRQQLAASSSIARVAATRSSNTSPTSHTDHHHHDEHLASDGKDTSSSSMIIARVAKGGVSRGVTYVMITLMAICLILLARKYWQFARHLLP